LAVVTVNTAVAGEQVVLVVVLVMELQWVVLELLIKVMTVAEVTTVEHILEEAAAVQEQ
jgi:hypothetical protein